MKLHEFKSYRRMPRPTRGLVLWAAFVLAIAFVHSPPALAHEHPAAPARGASARRSSAQYEIKFLKDMIVHHQMAVMMSEDCMKRATHDELKGMCRSMAADQAGEIRQMRTWLHEWHNVNVDSTMKHGVMNAMNGMASMKRLARLSGREYEIAFMKDMATHHGMAVQRADECKKRARHPELIALCDAIETNQTREIAQFKDWRCKWYQQCR